MSAFPPSPPATDPLPLVSMPGREELVWSNGLRVVLIEDHRFPLVHVHLGVDAGARHDPPGQHGLAGVVAALLKEGTSTRTAREIAEHLADIGGALHSAAEEDCLLVGGSSLSRDWKTLLDLLADITLNPSFPEEEVELYRRNRIQQLLDERSRPGLIAVEQLMRLVFGEHPYARVLPDLEFLQTFTPAELHRFHRQRFSPAQAFLILLGDLPPRNHLLDSLDCCLGSWRGDSPPAEPLPAPPPPRRTLILVDRPGSVQAEILIGRLAVTRRHPDHFPLLLATGVLGVGASSRLFHNIRETKGYAYSVGARFDRYKDAGSVSVYLQVRPDALGAALADTLDEISRLESEPAPEEELERVKNYTCGNFVLGLETFSSLISQMTTLYVNQLEPDYLERFPARVREVSAAVLQRVAREYFDPVHAAIVVVGEAAALRKELEPFGITATVSAYP